VLSQALQGQDNRTRHCQTRGHLQSNCRMNSENDHEVRPAQVHTCRSLCMAAGEAFALAALHQASTMARLTCFCCPAHTLCGEHCSHDKLQNEPTCSLRVTMPVFIFETASSCNAVFKRLTLGRLHILAFNKVNRKLNSLMRLPYCN